MKIALVGAGSMGSVHAEAYANNPNAQLVGIADSRSAVVRALADKVSSRAYDSLEQLMAAENPDVIDICLPTFLHKEYVIRAASYGKHVICEKPIAGTLEDARAMIDACNKAGVRLFVGHVLRFFPDYAKIRELVQAGEIGTVGTIRTERVSACPQGSDGWYGDFARSGGVLLDLLLHDFDWLRWTFGEVERVYARSLLASGDTQAPDHAFVTLRFCNGAIGYANGSWAYPEGFATRLEVAGDTGILTVSSEDNVTNRSVLASEHANQAAVQVPQSALARSPYEDELSHFLHCLKTDQEPIVNAEDAFEALRISLACIQSATMGKAVTLHSTAEEENLL